MEILGGLRFFLLMFWLENPEQAARNTRLGLVGFALQCNNQLVLHTLLRPESAGLSDEAPRGFDCRSTVKTIEVSDSTFGSRI